MSQIVATPNITGILNKKIENLYAIGLIRLEFLFWLEYSKCVVLEIWFTIYIIAYHKREPIKEEDTYE